MNQAASASASNLLSAYFGAEKRGLAWRPRPSNPALRDLYAHYIEHVGAAQGGSASGGFAEIYRAVALGDEANLVSQLRALAPDLLHIARIPLPVASTDVGLLAGAASLLSPLGVDANSGAGYAACAFFVEALGVHWDGSLLSESTRPFRIFSAAECMHSTYVSRQHLFIADDGAQELIWLAGSLRESEPAKSGFWRRSSRTQAYARAHVRELHGSEAPDDRNDECDAAPYGSASAQVAAGYGWTMDEQG